MASPQAAARQRAIAKNARVVREAGMPGVVLGPSDVPHTQWRTDLVEPILAFAVYGVPAPQGSKQGFIRGGKVVLKEQSAGLDPWRKAVRQVATMAVTEWSRATGKRWVALNEPVVIRPSITMPPTKAATSSHRVYCTSTPDLDKLLRAIGDALSPVPLKPKEGTEYGPARTAQVRQQMMEQRRTIAVLHDDSCIVAWDRPQKVYPAATPDALGYPGVTIEVFRMNDLDLAATRPVVSHEGGLGMRAADFASWVRHNSGQAWASVAARLWQDPAMVFNAAPVAMIQGRTVADSAALTGLRVLALEGPAGIVPIEFRSADATAPPPRSH